MMSFNRDEFLRRLRAATEASRARVEESDRIVTGLRARLDQVNARLRDLDGPDGWTPPGIALDDDGQGEL